EKIEENPRDLWSVEIPGLPSPTARFMIAFYRRGRAVLIQIVQQEGFFRPIPSYILSNQLLPESLALVELIKPEPSADLPDGLWSWLSRASRNLASPLSVTPPLRQCAEGFPKVLSPGELEVGGFRESNDPMKAGQMRGS